MNYPVIITEAELENVLTIIYLYNSLCYVLHALQKAIASLSLVYISCYMDYETFWSQFDEDLHTVQSDSVLCCNAAPSMLTGYSFVVFSMVLAGGGMNFKQFEMIPLPLIVQKALAKL